MPDDAATDPTVIFGVPLKPVALPVTFPVRLPTTPPDAVVTPVILTPLKKVASVAHLSVLVLK